ncbi:uncharacterized protein LOC105700352 [Orussus abietinus]|uniref:uncharacterized protein LOC105700352 n=1 Tax=Orussus abietinus TaxID=222816 RepID=UPI000625D354|nr:uncharacterized protein LOC105700352 [Orussus abietinus]
MDVPDSLVWAALTIILASASFAEDVSLNVNLKKPVAIASDKFLSLTIDPSVLLTDDVLSSRAEKTANMARALSPAFIRLGGPASNSYTFERSHFSREERDPNFTFSEAHWILVQQWAETAGLEVIACIAPHRSDNNGARTPSWDSRNALDLISFSDRNGYNMSWQLGYECQTRCDVSGTDLGKDVGRLRSMLDAFPRYAKSFVAGPDVVTFRSKQQQQYLHDYLNAAGSALTALTWHPDFAGISLDAEGVSLHHDQLGLEKDGLYRVLGRSISKKPLWIAESKPEECKKQFLGALVWTRRLGNAAKLGVQVIMRQPDKSNLFQPSPDYWVSVLHKMLVGREVLDAKMTIGNRTHVHFYCQCTRPSSRYEKGSLTVFGINLTPGKVVANLKGLKIKTLHKYILLPGFDAPNRMFAETVLLNNEPLQLINETFVPDINPAISISGKGANLKLPSGAIGFWVIPGLKIKSCMGHDDETAEKMLLKKLTKRLEDLDAEEEMFREDEEDLDLDISSMEDRRSLKQQQKKKRKIKYRHSEEDEDERRFRKIESRKDLEKVDRILKRRENLEERKPHVLRGRGHFVLDENAEKMEEMSEEEVAEQPKFTKLDSGEEIRAKLEEYKNRLIEYENKKRMTEDQEENLPEKINANFKEDERRDPEISSEIKMKEVQSSPVEDHASFLSSGQSNNAADVKTTNQSPTEDRSSESIESDKSKRTSTSATFEDQLRTLSKALVGEKVRRRRDAIVRPKRDLDKTFGDDPLGLRRDSIFRKRSKNEDIKERRWERRNRRKEKEETLKKEVQPVLFDPRNADSNENNFYGFAKRDPLKGFPEGDVYFGTGTSSEEKVKDYDYVKDDEEVETEEQKLRRRKSTSIRKSPEPDDTWIEEDTQGMSSYTPYEFFENVNMPIARIKENLRGYGELFEADSWQDTGMDAEEALRDDDAVADEIVEEAHFDEHEDKMAKESAVKTLINYYDKAEILKDEPDYDVEETPVRTKISSRSGNRDRQVPGAKTRKRVKNFHSQEAEEYADFDAMHFANADAFSEDRFRQLDGFGLENRQKNGRRARRDLNAILDEEMFHQDEDDLNHRFIRDVNLQNAFLDGEVLLRAQETLEKNQGNERVIRDMYPYKYKDSKKRRKQRGPRSAVDSFEVASDLEDPEEVDERYKRISESSEDLKKSEDWDSKEPFNYYQDEEAFYQPRVDLENSEDPEERVYYKDGVSSIQVVQKIQPGRAPLDASQENYEEAPHQRYWEQGIQEPPLQMAPLIPEEGLLLIEDSPSWEEEDEEEVEAENDLPRVQIVRRVPSIPIEPIEISEEIERKVQVPRQIAPVLEEEKVKSAEEIATDLQIRSPANKRKEPFVSNVKVQSPPKKRSRLAQSFRRAQEHLEEMEADLQREAKTAEEASALEMDRVSEAPRVLKEISGSIDPVEDGGNVDPNEETPLVNRVDRSSKAKATVEKDKSEETSSDYLVNQSEPLEDTKNLKHVETETNWNGEDEESSNPPSSVLRKRNPEESDLPGSLFDAFGNVEQSNFRCSKGNPRTGRKTADSSSISSGTFSRTENSFMGKVDQDSPRMSTGLSRRRAQSPSSGSESEEPQTRKSGRREPKIIRGGNRTKIPKVTTEMPSSDVENEDTSKVDESIRTERKSEEGQNPRKMEEILDPSKNESEKNAPTRKTGYEKITTDYESTTGTEIVEDDSGKTESENVREERKAEDEGKLPGNVREEPEKEDDEGKITLSSEAILEESINIPADLPSESGAAKLIREALKRIKIRPDTPKMKRKTTGKAEEMSKAREARMTARNEALQALKRESERKVAENINILENMVKLRSVDQKKKLEQLEKLKDRLRLKRGKGAQQYKDEFLEAMHDLKISDHRTLKKRDVWQGGKIDYPENSRPIAMDQEKFDYILANRPIDYPVPADYSKPIHLETPKYVPEVETVRPLHDVRERKVEPLPIHSRSVKDPKLLEFSEMSNPSLMHVLKRRLTEELEEKTEKNSSSEVTTSNAQEMGSFESSRVFYSGYPNLDYNGYTQNYLGNPEGIFSPYGFYGYTPILDVSSYDNRFLGDQLQDLDSNREEHETVNRLDRTAYGSPVEEYSNVPSIDGNYGQGFMHQILEIDPSTYTGGEPILNIREIYFAPGINRFLPFWSGPYYNPENYLTRVQENPESTSESDAKEKVSSGLSPGISSGSTDPPEEAKEEFTSPERITINMKNDVPANGKIETKDPENVERGKKEVQAEAKVEPTTENLGTLKSLKNEETIQAKNDATQQGELRNARASGAFMILENRRKIEEEVRKGIEAEERVRSLAVAEPDFPDNFDATAERKIRSRRKLSIRGRRSVVEEQSEEASIASPTTESSVEKKSVKNVTCNYMCLKENSNEASGEDKLFKVIKEEDHYKALPIDEIAVNEEYTKNMQKINSEANRKYKSPRYERLAPRHAEDVDKGAGKGKESPILLEENPEEVSPEGTDSSIAREESTDFPDKADDRVSKKNIELKYDRLAKKSAEESRSKKETKNRPPNSYQSANAGQRIREPFSEEDSGSVELHPLFSKLRAVENEMDYGESSRGFSRKSASPSRRQPEKYPKRQAFLLDLPDVYPQTLNSRFRNDERRYRDYRDVYVDLDSLEASNYELLMLVPVKSQKLKRQRRSIDDPAIKTLDSEPNELRKKIENPYRTFDFQPYVKDTESVKSIEDYIKRTNDILRSAVTANIANPSNNDKLSKTLNKILNPKSDLKELNKISLNFSNDLRNQLESEERTWIDSKNAILKSEIPDGKIGGSKPKSYLEDTIGKVEDAITGGLKKAENLSESVEQLVNDFDKLNEELEWKRAVGRTLTSDSKLSTRTVFSDILDNVKRFFTLLSGIVRVFNA